MTRTRNIIALFLVLYLVHTSATQTFDNTAVCKLPLKNGGYYYSPPKLMTCISGYEGSSCDTPICTPECMNGGNCVAPNYCRCRPGWIGYYCERHDTCQDIISNLPQHLDLEITLPDPDDLDDCVIRREVFDCLEDFRSCVIKILDCFPELMPEGLPIECFEDEELFCQLKFPNLNNFQSAIRIYTTPVTVPPNAAANVFTSTPRCPDLDVPYVEECEECAKCPVPDCQWFNTKTCKCHQKFKCTAGSLEGCSNPEAEYVAKCGRCAECDGCYYFNERDCTCHRTTSVDGCSLAPIFPSAAPLQPPARGGLHDICGGMLGATISPDSRGSMDWPNNPE